MPHGMSALHVIYYSTDDVLPSGLVPPGVSGRRSRMKGTAVPSEESKTGGVSPATPPGCWHCLPLICLQVQGCNYSLPISHFHERLPKAALLPDNIHLYGIVLRTDSGWLGSGWAHCVRIWGFVATWPPGQLLALLPWCESRCRLCANQRNSLHMSVVCGV